LGWRWIFWLLVILAGALFVMVFFFLPETLRSLVGDGSGYANPTPTQWLKARTSKDKPVSLIPPGEKNRFLKVPNVLQPIKYIFYHPDVATLLVLNGIPYAVFYCVLSTTTNLFGSIYGLNEQQIGLCYIANGCGCIAGGLIQGRVLDRDFRITAEKHGYDSSKLSRGSLGPDFPIFEARLRNIWVPLFFFDCKH
jgi:predicted MFS family arabinose efflux permease